MKYLDEYRDPRLARRLVDRIRATATRRWTIMEVCGGQTHGLVRNGIVQALEGSVRLIHGPGCPVCVTPVADIDRALAIASQPGVILCSFGDMLRVPGTRTSLLRVRAEGADVRSVYSPMDALRVAEQNPERQVVFFAVGFETTAPATALAVVEARRRGIGNISMLIAHVLVPPAMEAVLADPANQVEAFLAAGHVATVMGISPYPAIAERYRVPIIVTGFEPLDLLEGIWMAVLQRESGRALVENQYARSVRPEGNLAAQRLVARVYEPCAREWRGLGRIPASGLRLRPEFASWDADQRFAIRVESREDSECQSALVLAGRLRPDSCPAFGTRCTPEAPLGAPMVSSEGACAAYYHYYSGRQAHGSLTILQ